MAEIPTHNPPPPAARPRVLDQPPGPAPPGRSLWRSAVPLVAALLGLGWLVWGSGLWEQVRRPEPLLVALAETDAPRAFFDEGLPSSAEGGMMNLARGDCQTAAANFRTARRGAPEQARLWVLEGGAFVCAGLPAEARSVLEAAGEQQEPSRLRWWYLAQACLMQGDAACAADALHHTIAEDPRHERRAEAQLARLRDIQLQLSRR